MTTIEYRNLLKTISRSFGESVTDLVYLCEGKIPPGNTQNIHDVLSLFKEMEAYNTLGIDRLENLKDLLKAAEKWPLFVKVRKFEDKRKKYSELLQQISQALDGSTDLERLISMCRDNISEETEGNINSVRSLFRELENHNNLGFSRLDIVKEILNSVQQEDLIRKVEDFEQWRNEQEESECNGGQRAAMFALARSYGERVIGVLTMKTICQVGAVGMTLLTVNSLLKQSSTCDQLMKSFTACVLPAGTQLIEISQGCVCFTIRADNLAALCTLWDMYQDGTLKASVEKFILTDEMIRLAGGKENVELTVTIQEEEYEKALFEFIGEGEGAKHRKKGRRSSDSALTDLSNEEPSLIKFKQLENTIKLQEEMIKDQQKEMERLPKLLLETEFPKPRTRTPEGEESLAELGKLEEASGYKKEQMYSRREEIEGRIERIDKLLLRTQKQIEGRTPTRKGDESLAEFMEANEAFNFQQELTFHQWEGMEKTMRRLGNLLLYAGNLELLSGTGKGEKSLAELRQLENAFKYRKEQMDSRAEEIRRRGWEIETLVSEKLSNISIIGNLLPGGEEVFQEILTDLEYSIHIALSTLRRTISSLHSLSVFKGRSSLLSRIVKGGEESLTELRKMEEEFSIWEEFISKQLEAADRKIMSTNQVLFHAAHIELLSGTGKGVERLPRLRQLKDAFQITEKQIYLRKEQIEGRLDQLLLETQKQIQRWSGTREGEEISAELVEVRNALNFEKEHTLGVFEELERRLNRLSKLPFEIGSLLSGTRKAEEDSPSVPLETGTPLASLGFEDTPFESRTEEDSPSVPLKTGTPGKSLERSRLLRFEDTPFKSRRNITLLLWR